MYLKIFFLYVCLYSFIDVFKLTYSKFETDTFYKVEICKIQYNGKYLVHNCSEVAYIIRRVI